jgi:hypothetical protein
MATKEKLLEIANEWDLLADESARAAAWDRSIGLDLSSPGMSPGDRRACTARRAAETLRLEADTGNPHCMCHALPLCPTHKTTRP